MNYILFMFILFAIMFGTLGIMVIDLIKMFLDDRKEEKKNESINRFNSIMNQTNLRA